VFSAIVNARSTPPGRKIDTKLCKMRRERHKLQSLVQPVHPSS
jgi:hypothetical protein